MKVKFIYIYLSLFACLLSSSSSWALFQPVTGIEKSSIRKVLVSPFTDKCIAAAGEQILFFTDNGGKRWEKIFIAKGEDIKDIAFDTYVADKLYVATTSGVYIISSRRTKRLASLPPEVESICLRFYEGDIYLGTTRGLYKINLISERLKQIKGGWAEKGIYGIAPAGKLLYIAAEDGVYINTNGKEFIRKFVLKRVDEEDTEDDEYSKICIPRDIIVDIFSPEYVYLGTSCGMFISSDRGNTWHRLTYGIGKQIDIYTIVNNPQEQSAIYLATDRGIYTFNKKDSFRSRTLFEGLPTRKVYSIAFNHQGEILVATARGVFFQPPYGVPAVSASLKNIIAGEPPIEKVQQAALLYNEVDPDKIRRWRNALKYRALFPEISLDYDKSVYGTAGSSTYDGKSYVGPRDWGISLSWDVGDLVWNSYEDDVDTRSRLVTQLRINILDDVNTTYFERLRIKQRLIENNYPSTAERTRDLLRIRELEAILDGYTGGYFSRYLKNYEGSKE